jgi:hypothetical protein
MRQRTVYTAQDTHDSMAIYIPYPNSDLNSQRHFRFHAVHTQDCALWCVDCSWRRAYELRYRCATVLVRRMIGGARAMRDACATGTHLVDSLVYLLFVFLSFSLTSLTELTRHFFSRGGHEAIGLTVQKKLRPLARKEKKKEKRHLL